MFEGSMEFLRFLLSDEVQTMLVTYGEEDFGSTLFKPWLPELENPDSEIVSWVEEYAYIDGGECPAEYRQNAADLYN
jgi:hypothetical protein